MKYTIKSLAEELNLSRNTVAKVLNGKGGVSEKTRKLVLERVHEKDATMDRMPNSCSGHLPNTPLRKTVLRPAILLLLSEEPILTEFRQDLIRTIHQILEIRQFRLLVHTVSASDIASAQIPDLARYPLVEGILLAGIHDTCFSQKILQQNLPTAALWFSHNCEELIGRMNLFVLQRKITESRILTMLNREKAVSTDFLSDTETQSLEDHLKTMTNFPDVFFCESDRTAIRLLTSARSMGCRIPEDFSVIGFGNIPESAHTVPALTTIQNPVTEMAAAAAKQLTEQLKNPAHSCIYSQYIPSLIQRESTSF